MTNMIIMTAKSMMRTKQAAAVDRVVWEWQQYSFRAMNTAVHLFMAAPAQQRLIQRVEETFRYFEQLLSRFRPDSELSRFNGCRENVCPASPDFFAAVEASLWAAQQTGGIYDPTILSYLEEAGYDCTFGAVANPRPLLPDDLAAEFFPPAKRSSAGNLTGYDYRHIGLDPFTRMMSRPPGLRIDLGGMGKGWAVDRAADELCDMGHFLLNAGGDLYAYGTPGAERGWEVNLAHPQIAELNYAVLWLNHHALATSTTARRRWVRNGAVQHHLIDPRSGRPAETDALSVSVVAGRVFTAEIYAKTALILGIEEGLAFLEALPDVEGALFSTANEVYVTSRLDQYLERIDPAGC